MTAQEIEQAALKLSVEARARLASKLLTSLEELSEAEMDQVWAEEAQRRDATMDDDPQSELPAEEVLREARSKIK